MKTFIEIGSCDFQTLNHFTHHDGWNGVIVEPIKKYLDNLTKREGIQYMNYAIGPNDGTATMHVFKDAIIDKDTDYAGMSTMNPTPTNLARHNYTEIEVNTITYATLLKKCNIKRVDFVKIDTEGQDFKILKQINFYDQCRPHIIKIEHKHLDAKAMAEFLIKHGYHVDVQKQDIFAISLK